MNKFSKLVCFLLIGSAVFLAGCPKKPKRPDPSATTAGMGPGGLNATGVDLGDNLNGTGLENKPQGDARFAPENLERGVLPTIYFDYDRSGIKSSERTKLEQASKQIAELKGKQILLEGHCDWRGTAEYNMGLGDRRANAVKEYLAKLGVEVVRLEPLSKGDLDAKENATGDEMSKDRRVEIVIIKN
ncbi:MAG TPA: OmpA family protein [Opitutaceae bacterium]|nr:OmpA family protein [Opitutaceae bacterium]